MAGEWRALPLEDCMEAVIDYRGKTPEKTTFGVPLITAKVVKDGRIETPNEFIAIDDYEAWMRRGMPKAGDVVITTEAPLGEVAQLGTERVALAQRLIALRGKSGTLDNGFLKFLMQSENVQDQLRSRASGTTVLGIKQSELRKISLTIPPFPEQRAIAHILGTLDDKIELNRRMNETLETMARALFKSWFVDFDPVRAKMRHPSPSGRGAGGEGAGSEGPFSPTPKPHKLPLSHEYLNFVRKLRKGATDAETLMWGLLRNRRLAGLKFRRQHPFAPYVLDFFCEELKLALELDGGQHNTGDNPKRDRARSEFLKKSGIRVLRFWNNDVLKKTEAVLEEVFRVVTEMKASTSPSPPPPPLPGGEGELPKEILDLFPNSFQDSELGEIPEGWKVGVVDDEFKLTMGQSPPGHTYNEFGKGLPFYQGSTDFGFRFPSRRIYCSAPTRFAKTGDSLVSVRAPVGEINMATEDCAIGRGVAAVQHKSDAPSFTFQFLKSVKEVFAQFEAEGTVFGSIGKDNFHAIACVNPPREIVSMYESKVSAMDHRVEINEHESRTLTTLRDALLPKLISGKIRVKKGLLHV